LQMDRRRGAPDFLRLVMDRVCHAPELCRNAEIAHEAGLCQRSAGVNAPRRVRRADEPERLAAVGVLQRRPGRRVECVRQHHEITAERFPARWIRLAGVCWLAEKPGEKRAGMRAARFMDLRQDLAAELRVVARQAFLEPTGEL